jgi:hypothetical protein
MVSNESVVIGEIIINGEPRVTLRAETAIPLSAEGVIALKGKFAELLEIRFRAAESDVHRHRTITMAEVIETWHCYRSTVMRLIRQGRLHPTTVHGELQFDRREVINLAPSVPERP